MAEKVIAFEIPVPGDPELKARYLALGWFELPAGAISPARLRWSHARGSPIHPGDRIIDSVSDRRVDELLDWRLVEKIAASLPSAGNCDCDHIDALVLVSVRFQKRRLNSRHKGAGIRYQWEASDAAVRDTISPDPPC